MNMAGIDELIVQISTPHEFIDDALPENLNKVSIQVEASVLSRDKAEELPDVFNVNECTFLSNFQYWKEEKHCDSANNFQSYYFDAIVDMKEEAVPFIYHELQKGPTPLVHALDLIYSGEVKYDGYLPLEFVCATWLNILKQRKIASLGSF